MTSTKAMLPFNKPNASSPLDDTPYNSRLAEHQIAPQTELPQNSNASNYVLLGFRPGLPLQAAELNEIQENFFMQQSLTTTMTHNWITSGIPYRWNRDENATYPNGIESIGGADTDGAIEQPIPGAPHTVVSGPGWKGTTPLFPFKNPDIDYEGQSEEGSELILVTPSGSNLNIEFKEGWYLTELRRDQSTDRPNVTKKLQTGFKYWAYLEDPLYVTVPLPGTNDPEISVGFLVNLKTVTACQNVDTCSGWLSDNPSDKSLNDELGGGEYNINTGGADRIRVEFTNAYSSQNFEGNDISKVLKVIPNRQEVRYMNNLLLHKWGE